MAFQPGDTLLDGKYRIQQLLGRGGFGFVYHARETILDEDRAIKELIPGLVGDAGMLRRFLAEAKATIRLSHKRIVRTYDVFSQGGNYYIVMEYMPGGSLGDRLQGHDPLPVDDAVRIGVEVCEGLSFAHEAGVVHCDLKPHNILFDADGSAKLADFGIAHISGEAVTRSWATPSGFVAGTLPYMSPEQADGVRDDPRIDLYALGAVLYRMLTGRSYLEFDERDTPGAQADNVLRIRTQETVPPSVHNRGVPAWLDSLVLKALAKQPADRYASAAEMWRALLQQVPGARPAPPGRIQAAPAPSSPRRAPRPAWFWPVVGGAALLFLVLVLATVALLGGAGNDEQAQVMTVVVTSANRPTSSPTQEPPTSTPEPTVVRPALTVRPKAVPPILPPSSLYYEDDFGDPNSGWDVYTKTDTQAGYQDGEYRLAVYQAGYITWANPTLQQEFHDLEVAVDARLVDGPVDNTLGLLVRYQADKRSYYWFQISSDGYYSVDLFLDGEYVSLVKWTASEAIHQGLEVTNHLAVACDGNHFRFYVNGMPLGDVIDDTFASGGVGLAAGTFDEGGVVVHFDNFRVRRLAD